MDNINQELVVEELTDNPIGSSGLTEPNPQSPYTTRTSSSEVLEKHTQLVNTSLVPTDIIEAVPVPMIVLDENRQILVYNQAFLQHFDGLGLPLKIGLRPGESLNCIYAYDRETGCGTGRHCPNCGAFNAIITAQCGQSCSKRCELEVETTLGKKNVSAQVTASPITIADHNYVIVSLLDITGEVRRHKIDHIFFNDILNTVWTIGGYVNLLLAQGNLYNNDYIQRVSIAANQLLDEINSHCDLADAQAGELTTKLKEVEPKQIIQEIISSYKQQDYSRKLILLTHPKLEDLKITTDPNLLKRVLKNLLNAAAKSSDEGSLVEFGYDVGEFTLTFWLRNRTLVINDNTITMFKQSFSTTQWRELGSYTLEFIAQRYLMGTCDASYTENEGTCFTLTVPLHLSNKQ